MSDWLTWTDGPEQTRLLGRRFGELVDPGLVVLLNGGLGAGKTCFAQGIAIGLGVPSSQPVTSPSYSLMNLHAGRMPIYHFDLYRLSRIEDLADLGYDEFAEGQGLTLVEWADRLDGALDAHLQVTIERSGEPLRRFEFLPLAEPGSRLVEQLAQCWSPAASCAAKAQD